MYLRVRGPAIRAQPLCGAEGIANVGDSVGLSQPGFGLDYGVYMAEGRLGGLLARAVVVIAGDGIVNW